MIIEHYPRLVRGSVQQPQQQKDPLLQQTDQLQGLQNLVIGIINLKKCNYIVDFYNRHGVGTFRKVKELESTILL